MRFASCLVGVTLGVAVSGCSDPAGGTSGSGGSSGAGGSIASAGADASAGAGGLAKGNGGSSGSAGSVNHTGGSAGTASGAGGAGGDGEASSPRGGVVQVFGLLGLVGGPSITQVGAKFYDPEHPQTPDASCETSSFGPCTVNACPADHVAPDDSKVVVEAE